MPAPQYTGLIRYLNQCYEHESTIHYRCAPPPNTISIGGGEWMDAFFKMEAIRGFLSALREGKSLQEALNKGHEESTYAVRKWNRSRKDYQVHRWEKTGGEYLKDKVRHYYNMQGYKCPPFEDSTIKDEKSLA